MTQKGTREINLKVADKVQMIIDATKLAKRGCFTCGRCEDDGQIEGGPDQRAEYTQVPCTFHKKYVPVRINCLNWGEDSLNGNL